MSKNNDEILSSLSGKLRKATKTKTILAAPIKYAKDMGYATDEGVILTLEGPITVDLSDASLHLCRGLEQGEVWVQSYAKICEKYDMRGSPLMFWQPCVPKPDNKVFAAQVTDRDTFTIDAKWGTLNGVKGDYVLAHPTDLEDVWIVRKDLFESTYTFIKMCGCGGGCKKA